MLTQFLAADGVIDLAWGHPQPELLTPDLVADAAARALTRYGPDSLGYGASAGPPPLLEWLTAHLGRIDARAPAAGELMIVAGASQGLDMACTLLTRPGDVCLVPVPSYHLALRILRERPIEIVPVAADDDGATPDAITDAVARVTAAGKRARLLYLVPTSGNPTGVTLALERRQALVAIAARTGLILVEDDVYRELAFDAPAPPSLWSLGEPGTVVRLGSVSKTLAPGIRVGWMTADAPTLRQFWDGGLVDSGGGLNHVGALVVAELARSGAYETNLAAVRAALAARRDALVTALRSALPGATFRDPVGGYFLWQRLPGGLRARELLPIAERHGVSYLPGDVFTAGTDLGDDRVRLAFSRYPPADLAEAAHRLATAVAEARGGF